MVWILTVLIAAVLIYWLFISPYSQVFGKFPYKVKTKDKIVALTFDDGPNEPFTSQLLDYFEQKKVKATFFLVGKNALLYPNTVKKMHTQGHIIGNHSMSHQFHKYFSQPSFKKEIKDTQAIVTELTNSEPALFRPPWLWRQPMIFNTLKKSKITAVSGEFCDVLEVFQLSSNRIARRTLAKTKPGSIIIFHDGFDAKGADRTKTVEAVKIVVEALSKQGYKFVTVDKLLGIAPYKKQEDT